MNIHLLHVLVHLSQTHQYIVLVYKFSTCVTIPWSDERGEGLRFPLHVVPRDFPCPMWPPATCEHHRLLLLLRNGTGDATYIDRQSISICQ